MYNEQNQTQKYVFLLYYIHIIKMSPILFHIFQAPKGAVPLRINTTLYCPNLKLAKQHNVCKFFRATAPFLFTLLL